jgi:hypothetical protein
MPTYNYQLTWSDAANALADIMTAENRALRRGDTKTVANLQNLKQLASREIQFAYLAGPKEEIVKAAARIDQLVLEHEKLSPRRNKFRAMLASITATTTGYMSQFVARIAQ